MRIKRVVHETADAASFVLDVPAELGAAFAYAAGQFCTFRASIDGRPHLRCYSMSSSPEVDDELQVTVKRVPDGVVSNWMIDALAPGDTIDVTCPAGVFRLGQGDRDVVAFAGGSGITPVFSILKTALATTLRRVHLLYANRDREAVIFGAEIDRLAGRHAGRLQVTHHLDVDQGFVDDDEIAAFVDDVDHHDPDFYICGPGPFMDVVDRTLRRRGVDDERIHVERFTPPDPEATAAPGGPERPEATGGPEGRAGAAEAAETPTRITIEVDGRTGVTDHRPGTTLLQTARQLALSPPSSCEAGNCATCMARVVAGAATMRVNNALTEDEVADGWVLTCQAVPTSPSVHVIYG